MLNSTFSCLIWFGMTVPHIEYRSLLCISLILWKAWNLSLFDNSRQHCLKQLLVTCLTYCFCILIFAIITMDHCYSKAYVLLLVCFPLTNTEFLLVYLHRRYNHVYIRLTMVSTELWEWTDDWSTMLFRHCKLEAMQKVIKQKTIETRSEIQWYPDL
jgi:hypothetical protein